MPIIQVEKKYDQDGHLNKRDIDEEKAKAARYFEEKWKIVREDKDYLNMKKTASRPLWITYKMVKSCFKRFMSASIVSLMAGR